MSTAGVTGSPWICSGAMKAGVPSCWRSPVRSLTASSARAIPKSMTRGPKGESTTLEGLRSRCTMPALWIAVRAAATPTASCSRFAADSGPFSVTNFASVRPSMNSVTRYGCSASGAASSTSAVHTRATRRAVSASSRKRDRNSWSSATSARITLMATSRPVSVRPR